MTRKTSKTQDIESNIELKNLLDEIPTRKNYEIIRISRVKYKNNPNSYIDLRLFRKEQDEDENILHPTPKGIQFKEKDFKKLINKWILIPTSLLHEIIINKSWPHIERSEFSDAVFKAFKSVEIEVRKACGYPSDLIGIKLMRKAFDPENGPLTDYDIPKAERQAISELFSGTIGLYKNPHSHREVDLEFKEAFEMLLIATHLLNIIDKRKNQKTMSTNKPKTTN